MVGVEVTVLVALVGAEAGVLVAVSVEVVEAVVVAVVVQPAVAVVAGVTSQSAAPSHGSPVWYERRSGALPGLDLPFALKQAQEQELVSHVQRTQLGSLLTLSLSPHARI